MMFPAVPIRDCLTTPPSSSPRLDCRKAEESNSTSPGACGGKSTPGATNGSMCIRPPGLPHRTPQMPFRPRGRWCLPWRRRCENTSPPAFRYKLRICQSCNRRLANFCMKFVEPSQCSRDKRLQLAHQGCRPPTARPRTHFVDEAWLDPHGAWDCFYMRGA